MCRFLKSLPVFATLLSCAAPAWGQTPLFSLWVTEVNGVPCASCPTQNLPATEVNQGDVIRVDAFVENWDDNPSHGVCSGNPPVFGYACNVGVTGSCSGKHCTLSGGPCNVNNDCFSRQCVPSTCIPAPQVSVYQWTIDAASYTNGVQGHLAPARIPCLAADCAVLADGTCPCTQYHQHASQCTCAFAGSCAADGFCNPQGSAFIETTRSDFIFFDHTVLMAVCAGVCVNYEWAAAVDPYYIADNGSRRYLGTLLLTPSSEALGTFTLRMRASDLHTFLGDSNAALLAPSTLVPLTITLPCDSTVCDDDDPCTVDSCSETGSTCRHEPRLCPTGQTCVAGMCRNVRRVRSGE